MIRQFLNAAAAETAVTGVEMDREKDRRRRSGCFFPRKDEWKMIFLENITTRVDLSGKKIEVEVFASKGRMKIHLIQRATKVKPEEKVRWEKIDFCKAEKVKGERKSDGSKKRQISRAEWQNLKS